LKWEVGMRKAEKKEVEQVGICGDIVKADVGMRKGENG
jgi:hypothetical protein